MLAILRCLLVVMLIGAAGLGCKSREVQATEQAGAPLLAAVAEPAPSVVRIAIGTQDTTINCATAGLIIREEGLLERHLPRTGKYEHVKFEVVWKNFTSGPPLTSEMVAGKLDIGMMGDFPAVLNGVALAKAGRSLYVATISGSTLGGGNAIVVPKDSPVRSLADLKGKQLSVPFGSAAHGMLLRAIRDLDWDPEKDVNLVSQSPEVGGTSLKSGKIDAHADFVPFGELFPFRGFARKIYDGAMVNRPTSHGILARAEFASEHSELLIAYLESMLEAEALMAKSPEQYSQLIEKVTGVEAEVSYMFHGPLGVQTRDYTLKPEYKQGLAIAAETLSMLKRMEGGFDVDAFVDDRFIRAAAQRAGLDYDARLKNYDKVPLTGTDARSGEAIGTAQQAAQIWLTGEPLVRRYASIASALSALGALESEGKRARVVYVHDASTGVKLLAQGAWYVQSEGSIRAYLLERDARRQAAGKASAVLDLEQLKARLQ